MLLLLFMLLLKYYPEEKICEFLVLKKKGKMSKTNLNSDLKEEPDLKSCFTLFEPVMPGSWISLNLLKFPNVGKYASMCNVVNMPEYESSITCLNKSGF